MQCLKCLCRHYKAAQSVEDGSLWELMVLHSHLRYILHDNRHVVTFKFLAISAGSDWLVKPITQLLCNHT